MQDPAERVVEQTLVFLVQEQGLFVALTARRTDSFVEY